MSRRAALAVMLVSSVISSLDVEAAEPVRKESGIDERIPWVTSHVVGTPDPPSPFDTEIAFPKLRFEQPVEMTQLPNSKKLIVIERFGVIHVFDDDLQTDRTEKVLELPGRQIMGVAFHPKFPEVGDVYITSHDDVVSPTGMRLSRFTVMSTDPLRVDPKSEVRLLAWSSEGHKGGCLRFGPDGMLYVAVGDGSGIADGHVTGQKVDDLEASLLRLDVDRRSGAKPYSIPADNPFAKTPGARGEVWAYGLRQPWKFAFHPQSGEVWTGDVGQDLWEMVYLVKRGGNYGWSKQEGTHPFRPEREQGPTPIEKPIVEHPHTDFRSITGGFWFASPRLPELKDAYIYGDYDTGKIHALRYAAGKLIANVELADTPLRIVSFGRNDAGEVFAVDFMGGRIHRLVKAPPPDPNLPPFPRKLSETGLFASTHEHRVAPGLIPYSVNAPLWSDGAIKDRFLALPGDAKIEFETVTYPQPAPGSTPGWRFPDGTVIVKTFSLEMEAGRPESRRRLETRLLHLERTEGSEEVGTQVWHGYTYVWNDEQTEALLLEAQGLNRTFDVKDPAAPNGIRKQTWRFPSRSECSLCHTTPAKYALGLDTLQMNKNHDYGGVVANQLRTFDHLGLFTEKLPKSPDQMDRLVDYHDESQDRNRRARSYLHANCSHCHRKWGGGNADFQLLATLPLTESAMIGTKPGQGTFDVTDPRILVPGDPQRSMLLHRMQKLGLGRMPHIASNQRDEPALKLLTDWIRDLPRSGDAKRTGLGK